MPTGYTEGVAKGEITTLKEFALLCSRNFAPVYSVMRDAPLSKSIPQVIEPDTFYLEKLEETNKKYQEFLTMSEEEKKALYESSIREKSERNKELLEIAVKNNEKYTDMLKKVEGWEPPTKSHIGLKQFMINQLTISLEDVKYYSKLDSAEPYSYKEFLKDYKDNLISDIKYYTDNWKEAVRRAEEGTKWLAALRESLNGQS